MIVEPSVTLLAHTTIDADAISELMEIQPQSTDAETLVTFAGRSCYESWHRPSEATRDDADYINRTIFEQQHGSILEHATALDTDKLQRALGDGMEKGGLLRNDARIITWVATKHYAKDRTGCQVTVVKHGATAVHIDFKELE